MKTGSFLLFLLLIVVSGKLLPTSHLRSIYKKNDKSSSLGGVPVTRPQTRQLPTSTKPVEPPGVYHTCDPKARNSADKAWTSVMIKVDGAGERKDKEFDSIELVLAIDCSGSMEHNDPENITIAASKECLARLDKSNDFAGVVAWHNSAALEQGLTHNFHLLERDLDSIVRGGGTNLDAGLESAVTMLMDSSHNNRPLQAIVFMTDGNGPYTYCRNRNSPVRKAQEAGIRVYSIGLDSHHSSRPLIDMARCTDGQYFAASKAEDVTKIFEEVNELMSPVNTVPYGVKVAELVTEDFRVNQRSVTPKPSFFKVYSDGTTRMEWDDIDAFNGLEEGQEFVIEFEARAVKSLAEINDVNSAVSYKSFDDAEYGAVPIPVIIYEKEHIP